MFQNNFFFFFFKYQLLGIDIPGCLLKYIKKKSVFLLCRILKKNA